MKTIPHMIDQTQPKTKIAVVNCRIAERKQIKNDRQPCPGPYSVWEPRMIVNDASRVPVRMRETYEKRYTTEEH